MSSTSPSQAKCGFARRPEKAALVTSAPPRSLYEFQPRGLTHRVGLGAAGLVGSSSARKWGRIPALSITWIQQTKVALDVQLKALSEDQLSRTYVVAGGIGLSLKQSLIALADIHVQCKARVTEFDTIVKDIC